MNRDADASRERLRALMQRLSQGDRSALEPIYRATNAKLFGICLRILNDRKEAEDALQDVYLNLFRNAQRYDSQRGSPIAWLAVLARNRAVDRLRSGKVRAGAVPVDDAMPLVDDVPLADEQMIDAERSARIHACLETLSESQRTPIRAAFLGGSTYARLAKEADLPLNTMKSRIRRGLARMRDCLEKDG